MPSYTQYLPESLRRGRLDSYQRIADCLAGQDAVKKRGTEYLPAPATITGKRDTTSDARYAAYLARAVFVNFTRRTVDALTGIATSTKTAIKLPDQLGDMRSDADGAGTDLHHMLRSLIWSIFAYGRAAIYANFYEGRPVLWMYDAPDIHDYATDEAGRIVMCQLVERATVRRARYEYDTVQYRRGLWMEDGMAWSEVLRDDGGTAVPGVQVKGYGGSKFGRMPVVIINADGRTGRDAPVPPILDIADLNLAHYRNSADWEESCFMVGQPTLVLTGVDTGWAESHAPTGKVPLGSSAVIPLPLGATAQLLQALPNQLPGEAMRAKEAQMVALGARLIMQPSAQAVTATQAQGDQASSLSVVGQIAQSAASGLATALRMCAEYVGASADDVEVLPNTDYMLSRMSATDVASYIKAWQTGSVTFAEMRQIMRAGGIQISEDDELAMQQMEDAAIAAQPLHVGMPPAVTG